MTARRVGEDVVGRLVVGDRVAGGRTGAGVWIWVAEADGRRVLLGVGDVAERVWVGIDADATVGVVAALVSGAPTGLFGCPL